MMIKIWKYIRSFIISFEILTWIIVMILWWINSKFIFAEVFKLFFETTDIEHVSFAFVIPLAMTGISYKMAHSTLNPEKNGKLFYNWPDYYDFKITVIIGLIWNILAIVVTGLIYLRLDDKNEWLISALYIASCISSIISTLSLVLARQKLNEILTLNSPED